MYTPKLIHAYKQSRSSLPIGTWVRVVGRRLPQFRNEKDMYRPIPLQVKLAGSLNDSDGSVLLSVNATDEDWYPNLQDALEEMTGKSDLTVVNYLGEPIKDMTVTQLMHTGECDLVDRRGETVRLPSIVAPPLRLSTNKQAALKNWWTTIRSPLARTVAETLKDMSMSEIAKATASDGIVRSNIQEFLKHSALNDMSWGEFVDTYGSGNTPVESIGAKLLESVKAALVANKNLIRTHHASVGAEMLWEEDAPSTRSRFKDAYTMYRDIAEDAMYHPLVGQNVIREIVYGTAERKPSAKPVARRITSTFHPMSAYYQQHHYNVHGQLPGHRIEALNVGRNLNEAYIGDATKAVDMFNLFSGRAVRTKDVSFKLMPIKTAIDRIACGSCSKGKRKGKGKKGDRRLNDLVPIESNLPELVPIAGLGSRMPDLIPIKSNLPELVPIAGCHHDKRKKKGKKKEESLGSRMPDLVPIESNLPELVPIAGCHHDKQKKKGKKKEESLGSRMPDLIPIESNLPELVPIAGCHHDKRKTKKEESLGSRMPDLVPIQFRAENRRDLDEHLWVDSLPGIADFLKK